MARFRWFFNLITNAIHASPTGGHVGVDARTYGDNLILDVIDSGCGIPAEKREAVFSPFFTTKKEGIGLGLPIVKKVVEAHDGNLAILDNPGGGLTFRIVIPGARPRTESKEIEAGARTVFNEPGILGAKGERG
ncbi:MAG: ATP-binding protein [Desulfobacteraceae bacterium]|nr:ATP-binding protein [Desulfobacteraceae bacterium]